MTSNHTLISRILGLGEKKMTDLTNELLSNPKFANTLGMTIQKAMETKGRIDKNIQLAFAAVNMPTKEDYDRLVKKVNNLNKNLNEIDLRIDSLVKNVEAMKKPAAAKKVVAVKKPAAAKKPAAKKAVKKPVKKVVKKAAKKKSAKK